MPAALAAVCLFSGIAVHRRSGRRGFRRARHVPGHAAMGVCRFVLGSCAGGSVPSFCVCFRVIFAREPKRARRLVLGAGRWACRGWATVTEYPAAPASAMVALLALSQAWQRGSAARWRVIAGVGFGATLCLVVLLGYLYAAFGTFRPSYSYYDPNSFSFMRQQGYMGLTYPHPDRLLKIMFGCARGLFFASPVLAAAAVGLWWLWRRTAHRAAAITAVAIVSYYFLFNASFYWWKAGLAFGPRYAGASIPFLCIGLAAAWGRATRVWRRVLVGLALCSVMIALMVISTTSQLAMQDSCPIVHSAWPAFWAGQMALNRESMLTVAEAGMSGRYGAFNVGQLMGLRGLASLVPLLAMWGLAALLWWRMMRSSGGSKSV